MDIHSKALLILVYFNLILAISHALPSLPHQHDLPRLGQLRDRPIPEDLEQDQRSKIEVFDTYYYNQTIDHFNYRPASYRKFKQRYLIDTKYWGGPKNNSPIFVYLGAEQTIDTDLSIVGWFRTYAPSFKALIVFIEHRFYGESNPKGSISEALDDEEERGYFNSAQALADYAEIILHLKRALKAYHCPIIVFGGSYGGLLAAWFRLKYPHVAHGALASSAPMLSHVVSPYTYYNWASKDFRDTSETCYHTIKKSWKEIDRVASKPNGLSILNKKFKLCSPLKKSSDVKSLKSQLKVIYRQAAQYDAPPDYPVTQICKAIDKASPRSDLLDKIAAAFASQSQFDKVRKCYGDSDQSNNDNENDDDQETEQSLGWFWQVCSEIVNPEGKANDSMFEPEPFTVKGYMNKCENIFDVSPRPYWFDTYYGAKDIKLFLHNFGSNIIFYNGLRDPLSQESVLESLSDTLVAVNAPKGSHSLDLLRSSRSDPKWLVMVRNKEAAIIKGWIAKYNADLAAFLKGRK